MFDSRSTRVTMNISVVFCLCFVVVNVHLILPTQAVDISQCIAPLGMENGLIKDDDISASSSFDSSNVGPHHGRLKNEKNGGAWCPKLQATKEASEWLEIDLHGVHLVTGAATQGRFGNGQGVEYAEAYVLEYWRPKLAKWVRFRDITGEEVIQGNINTYLESKTDLDPPVWATKVRFMPYSFHRRTVCMRVELYGCRWSDGVLSYSMPQGDKRGNDWEFFDTIYDGHWDGEELQRGLGKLTDGKVGPDNFKIGYYENDRSQGWVGWRNDTRANRPIEIKFEFDTVREFTCVHIYCNNQFTKDIQVFSEAKVMFSVGGRKYKGEPITYTYFEDRIFENSRNVSIKLHHRVGRFVKLQLHFAAKWIMISEVTFDSGPVTGNFTDEEEDENLGDSNRDSSLQKDQVQNSIDDERNVVSSVNNNSGLRKYFGVVVGVLSVIVLVMVVAIVFIVIYQRRLKATAGHSVLPGADNRLNSAGKVSMDECDKAALYHEPCRFNMYSASGRESLERYPGTPEYTDVKDLAYQEYAVPHQSGSEGYGCVGPIGRPPPPLQTLLPKPPPVPPPPAPEQYYAATEICTGGGYVPPPPPLATPPTVRLNNRHPRTVSSPQRKYVGP